MTLRKLFLGIFTLLIVSCGSTDRIIAEDGTVYDVKGDTFIADGEDVTESLSRKDKKEIKNLISEKREAEKEAEKLKRELERKQKELKRTQRELEEKQRNLEQQLEDKKEAREDFLEVKERLKKETSRFETLKEKEKLSPRDEEKWVKKIEELEDKLAEAKKRMDDLNKDK